TFRVPPPPPVIARSEATRQSRRPCAEYFPGLFVLRDVDHEQYGLEQRQAHKKGNVGGAPGHRLEMRHEMAPSKLWDHAGRGPRFLREIAQSRGDGCRLSVTLPGECVGIGQARQYPLRGAERQSA